MPSQLNGKRAPGRSRSSRHNRAAPATVRRTTNASPRSSASAHTPLRARAFGKVADVAPSARIPANERDEPRARPMSHAAAGKRTPASCRDSIIMTCDLEAPRPLLLCRARRFLLLVSLSLSLGPALGADGTLDPVVVTGTREPEPLGRSTADIVVIDAATIRNTTADSVEDLIRRERRHAAGAQRRPGPELGLLRSRREHQQHGRPGRRRARRLGDARPGRVRGA